MNLHMAESQHSTTEQLLITHREQHIKTMKCVISKNAVSQFMFDAIYAKN